PPAPPSSHLHQALAAPAPVRPLPHPRQHPPPAHRHLRQEHRPSHPPHHQHPRHLQDRGGPHPARPGTAPRGRVRVGSRRRHRGLRGVARHHHHRGHGRGPAFPQGRRRSHGPGRDPFSLLSTQVFSSWRRRQG